MDIHYVNITFYSTMRSVFASHVYSIASGDILPQSTALLQSILLSNVSNV